jgi:hypothetical protein
MFMRAFVLGLFGENMAAFAYTLFLLIFLVVVLAEAIIIFLMKYNLFKKAFTDSLLANLFSVTAAVLILLVFFAEKFPTYGLKNLLLLFIIALAGESVVLWFLNPSKPILKSITVSAVMNLVTFLIVYFIAYPLLVSGAK